MATLATWVVVDLLLLVVVLAVLAVALGWGTRDLMWTAAIWIAISAVWFGAEAASRRR